MELNQSKRLAVVPIEPPSTPERVRRDAKFAEPGARATRYTLPSRLDTTSPVGYRTRVPLSQAEAKEAMGLLSLERPTRFVRPEEITEGELFEECALGILSSRQSTNYRGHRQVSFGPQQSALASCWPSACGWGCACASRP